MILQIPVLIPRTVPQRSAKITQARQRENANMFREVLLDLLQQHGPLKVSQFIEFTGASATTVREYMCKLINEGRAVSTRTPNGLLKGAGWVAVYSLSDGSIPPKGEMLKQMTVTSYPLNHVRDPYALPANFFGPART